VVTSDLLGGGLEPPVANLSSRAEAHRDRLIVDERHTTTEVRTAGLLQEQLQARLPLLVED